MSRRFGYRNFIRKIEGKTTGVRYHSFGSTRMFHDFEVGKYTISPRTLDWIGTSFSWDSTPQGFGFWGAINQDIGDQQLACEILTSWREQGYV